MIEFRTVSLSSAQFQPEGGKMIVSSFSDPITLICPPMVGQCCCHDVFNLKAFRHFSETAKPKNRLSFILHKILTVKKKYFCVFAQNENNLYKLPSDKSKFRYWTYFSFVTFESGASSGAFRKAQTPESSFFHCIMCVMSLCSGCVITILWCLSQLSE